LLITSLTYVKKKNNFINSTLIWEPGIVEWIVAVAVCLVIWLWPRRDVPATLVGCAHIRDAAFGVICYIFFLKEFHLLYSVICSMMLE
jgi:sterol desaturase/sphingolipid hydroxylase (fatty acid hydroxylase superfamily)